MKHYFKNIFGGRKSPVEPPFSEVHQQVLNQSLQLAKEIKQWLHDSSYEKISIGENCNSSWYLKATNNKSASYPYDWIFSSPDIIAHTLRDDFKMFLDKDLIYTINAQRGGHRYYHSGMFNHRNPLNSDEDYTYYKRSVDRFRGVLSSDNPILFICTVINEHHKRPGWAKGFDKAIKVPVQNQSLNDFKDLMTSINERHTNAKFLFVEQYTEGMVDIRSIFKDERVFWLRHTAQGKNTGVKYEDAFDDTIAKNIYTALG